MAREPKEDGRRQRSRRTRARIVDAAARLLVDQGYLATTIEAVAERAGVAVQTVYYVFGNKRNLLAAVLDVSIAGDVEPVATLERSWVDTLRDEQDPTAVVERLIDATVAIVARATPIYEVLRQAAADPDVAALLDDTRRRRRQDQRQLIDIVAQSGHLHPDVDVETAADIFYALMNEEVFQLLTRDCEWDLIQFHSWATSTMLHQLVGTGTTRAKQRHRRARGSATTPAP